jgi:uncharacterized protein YggU (UPF0235/DUF167 family)
MYEDTYIHVRVTTQAKKECVEKKKDTYFISVKEKPKEGKANKRIKELLAETLACNQKALLLVKGGTTPSKTFLFINK